MDLRKLPPIVAASIVVATPFAEQLVAAPCEDSHGTRLCVSIEPESQHIDLTEVNQPTAHSPPTAVSSRAIFEAHLSAGAGLSGMLT